MSGIAVTIIDLFFLANRARKRRDRWRNREEAFDYFRSKSLFNNFQPEFLESYIIFGLKPSQNGDVELLCPKDTEAKLFEFFPLDIWFWPKRIRVSTLIIRGGQSNTLLQSEFDRFCRKCPAATGITIEEAGHLIPMESPETVADLIIDFSSKAQAEGSVL